MINTARFFICFLFVLVFVIVYFLNLYTCFTSSVCTTFARSVLRFVVNFLYIRNSSASLASTSNCHCHTFFVFEHERSIDWHANLLFRSRWKEGWIKKKRKERKKKENKKRNFSNALCTPWMSWCDNIESLWSDDDDLARKNVFLTSGLYLRVNVTSKREEKDKKKNKTKKGK